MFCVDDMKSLITLSRTKDAYEAVRSSFSLSFNVFSTIMQGKEVYYVWWRLPRENLHVFPSLEQNYSVIRNCKAAVVELA